MHTWHSTVRDYELDIQQIVNNANYLNYFEHARHLMLRDMRIDFVTYHRQHLDFILVETTIRYKYPLRSGDEFIISSTMHPKSHVTFMIKQVIHLVTADKLVAEAENIITCIDRKRNKVCMPQELRKILKSEA